MNLKNNITKMEEEQKFELEDEHFGDEEFDDLGEDGKIDPDFDFDENENLRKGSNEEDLSADASLE